MPVTTPTPETEANTIRLELDHGPFKTIEYVTLDFARTLEINRNNWEQVAEKLFRGLRENQRIMFGHAPDCDCDKCEALTAYNELLNNSGKEGK